MAVDQEREILEIKKLVNENHKILRGMQRKTRISAIFHAIKWIVIALIALKAYTVVQPIFEQMYKTYTSIAESAETIKNAKNSLPSGIDLKNLFNGN